MNTIEEIEKQIAALREQKRNILAHEKSKIESIEMVWDNSANGATNDECRFNVFVRLKCRIYYPHIISNHPLSINRLPDAIARNVQRIIQKHLTTLDNIEIEQKD